MDEVRRIFNSGERVGEFQWGQVGRSDQQADQPDQQADQPDQQADQPDQLAVPQNGASSI